MRNTPRVKNLTKRTVEAAKPEARRYILWDATLKGFGVRIEPVARDDVRPRKTFIARYRAGGGRTGTLRQATIGRFGTITVDQARRKAKTILGAAAGGSDPVGETHEKRRAGITVNQICDWYLDQAASGRLLSRKGRPIKPSTLAVDRSRIETHVRRLIGRRRVATLSVHDLEELQADIANLKATAPIATGKAGRVISGGPAVAARTLGTLSAIFGHAVRKGLIAVNPAAGARKLAVHRRTARLSLDQVRALGEAMRASSEHPAALAAIRFLLLTGTRRSEALGARYEALLPEGGLRLDDSKTGPQNRPIGKAALAPFRHRGQGWLFPGHNESHFKNVPAVLKRLCVKAGLPMITPHTLRHSFASISADIGYSQLVIDGLLGHSMGAAAGGYVHLDSALVAAANRVSAVIARALDGEADADVVRLQGEAV